MLLKNAFVVTGVISVCLLLCIAAWHQNYNSWIPSLSELKNKQHPRKAIPTAIHYNNNTNNNDKYNAQHKCRWHLFAGDSNMRGIFTQLLEVFAKHNYTRTSKETQDVKSSVQPIDNKPCDARWSDQVFSYLGNFMFFSYFSMMSNWERKIPSPVGFEPTSRSRPSASHAFSAHALPIGHKEGYITHRVGDFCNFSKLK